MGAFGKYGVDIATLWGIGDGDDYAAPAFELYRDYDGEGGTYGNTDVRASTSDRENTSVYTAIEDDDPSTLHVILLNKNREGPFEVQLEVESTVTYSSGKAWSFDGESAPITEDEDFEEEVDVGDGTRTYVLLSLTAAHIVLRSSDEIGAVGSWLGCR